MKNQIKKIGRKAIDYVVSKWNGDLFDKGMIVFYFTLLFILIIGLIAA